MYLWQVRWCVCDTTPFTVFLVDRIAVSCRSARIQEIFTYMLVWVWFSKCVSEQGPVNTRAQPMSARYLFVEFDDIA